eukprot:TRINITY_DN4588_c0_g1_i1.p1 TRINITY_DN4588_c0_g1~~TRINITY_DN4588_c0_g1_i1.p1  ORF type:complete len:372 (-),score=51.03 TRINITY_DN4588_c0_g1_i1:308-1423(-)
MALLLADLCIPDELILEVFKELTAAQLCTVSRVSKRFQSLAYDDSLWSPLCKLYFDLELVPQGVSWRSAFSRIANKLTDHQIEIRGTNRWLEPPGYKYDQATVMTIRFSPGLDTFLGSGLTHNKTVTKQFRVEGEKIGPREYYYRKIYDSHSTHFTGSLSYSSGSLQLSGQVKFYDGKRDWSGEFVNEFEDISLSDERSPALSARSPGRRRTAAPALWDFAREPIGQPTDEYGRPLDFESETPMAAPVRGGGWHTMASASADFDPTTIGLRASSSVDFDPSEDIRLRIRRRRVRPSSTACRTFTSRGCNTRALRARTHTRTGNYRPYTDSYLTHGRALMRVRTHVRARVLFARLRALTDPDTLDSHTHTST